MNLKDVKELKKCLKEALNLLEVVDAKESDSETLIQKSLNREAHLLNENEKLQSKYDALVYDNEALKNGIVSLENELSDAKHKIAELEAKNEKLRKYKDEAKKPVKKPVSGFRIKEE